MNIPTLPTLPDNKLTQALNSLPARPGYRPVTELNKELNSMAVSVSKEFKRDQALVQLAGQIACGLLSTDREEQDANWLNDTRLLALTATDIAKEILAVIDGELTPEMVADQLIKEKQEQAQEQDENQDDE